MSEPNNESPNNGSITSTAVTETISRPLISITSNDSNEAYGLMRHEIDAVPAARALPINTDVGFAVQTALWMSGALEALRPELANAVPGYDLSILPRFRAAALALNYLQSRIRVLLRSTNSPLVEWLLKRRAIFFNDANGLVLRDLIDGAPLQELRHANNHQLLGYDVMGLVDLLLEHYDKFGGKCMTSQQELFDARFKANELFTELGTKHFGPKANTELKLLRRQCFVLLGDLWTELDAFVRFARRQQGDADQLLPSLYPKRARKGTKPNDADDDELEPAETDGSDDAAVGAGGGTAADPLALDAHAINQTLAAATNAAGSAAPIRPGFPGAPALRTTVEE